MAKIPYTLKDGKVVNIPSNELTNLQQNLKINRTEAVDLWLYDHEYIDNEEADRLTAKAKEAEKGNRKNAKAEKPKTQRERVRKIDEVKQTLIKAMAEASQIMEAEVVITNDQKSFTIKIGEDTYNVNLSKQRKPKT